MKKKLMIIIATVVALVVLGVIGTVAIISRSHEPVQPVGSTTVSTSKTPVPGTTGTPPKTDPPDSTSDPVKTTAVKPQTTPDPVKTTKPEGPTAKPETTPAPAQTTKPETTPKPAQTTAPKPDVPDTPCKHVYKDTVTAPTCIKGGYTTHTCTLCGHAYTDGETKALGHNYQSKTTAPTCTAGGSTKYTCTRCKDSYAADKTAALGHNWKKGTTVEPTTTAQGYTNYTCDRCKQTKKDNYTDPISENSCQHEWEFLKDRKPTETLRGRYEYRCKVCFEYKFEYYSAPLGKFTGCDNPKHSCRSWEDHYRIIELEKEGCGICGKHDCPRLYGYKIPGGYYFADELCPEYDEHKDPSKYCQRCGMMYGFAPDLCNSAWTDHYCLHCGEYVHANECHHCTDPLGDKYVPYVYEYCIYCGELYTNGSDEHDKTCPGQN